MDIPLINNAAEGDTNPIANKDSRKPSNPYRVTVGMEVEEWVFEKTPIEFDKLIKDEIKLIAKDLVEFWLAKYLELHPEVMPVIKGEVSLEESENGNV